MIPEQTLVNFPEFANSGTKTQPGSAKYSAGFQEADVLPAEWLNFFINKSSAGVSALNEGVESVEAELNNVLTEAGITPVQGTNNQVVTAIKNIFNAVTGTLSNLTTTVKTNLVSAINEVKGNINAMTLAQTGGTGKVLTTIQQANGVVTVTAADVLSELDATQPNPINSSAVNDALLNYDTSSEVTGKLNNALSLNTTEIVNDNFSVSKNSKHDYIAPSNGLYYIAGNSFNDSSIATRTHKVLLNDVYLFNIGHSSSYQSTLGVIMIPVRKNDKVTIERLTSEYTYTFMNIFIPTVF